MMPSAKHGDPQLGVDIHLCVVPPSPSPVPLPVPHLSAVFDPFDYVPILGATVEVAGMKRATAGTGAIVIHIPPGFPFAPQLPEKDDELFMGSSSVVADGDPLSYLALPVLDCQVVGMPSPPRPKKRRIPRPTLLPTSVNLAIPTNVFVGGAPTISMMGMAMRGAFAGLGKLAKSKFAKRLGERFKKFRQKLFKNMDSGFLKCKVLRAEPVNILTGEVSVEQVDFTLPGRIPIEWVRSYASNRSRRGACGVGWESPADARLEFDLQDGSVMFYHPMEGPAIFPERPVAEGDEAAVLELMDGALLSDHGEEWRVRTKSDLIYHFPKTLIRAGEGGLEETPLARISDLCGNWLEFERVGGRLKAIRESGERYLRFEYVEGYIRSVTLFVPASGFTHTFATYEYDISGNLIAVRDALDHPYRFAYEGSYMVCHTNRTGLSFYYEYDKRGEEWRVVHAWGDGGLYDYRFAYWSEIRETRITNSLGHVTTVKSDENGLPILEIDPLGGRTIFEYDEVGRTIAVVDADNHRTEYLYDERGNLLKFTRPDGLSIETEFSQVNKIIRVTDPNGAEWRQEWDERGLLTRQIMPLGSEIRYEYDWLGQLATFVNQRNKQTCLAFDLVGNLVGITDALGNTNAFTYDHYGSVTRKIDPLGQQTAYDYDRKGRLINTTLPSGVSITFGYDAEDNLTCYVDENGAETRFEYFGQGEIGRRIQPDGYAVEFHYDTEEQLVGVTNQRGEIYCLNRDPLGRVIEEIDYWGQPCRYEYTACGHIKSAIDPLGRTISYNTDLLGRILKKTLPDGFVEEFSYDGNGNLLKTRNPHIAISRQYDAEGRLTEEVQGDFVIRNGYDERGNRIARETSLGNRVEYEYDALDHVVSVGINQKASITIERDSGGRIVREQLGQKLSRRFRYGMDGYLVEQAVSVGRSSEFFTHFEYDPAGNLTRRSDSEHGVDLYRYDPMGRITEHIDPQGRLTPYLNDPAGDRLTTRVYEGRHQRVAGGEDFEDEWCRLGEYEGIYYRFDRAGNLIHRRNSECDLHLVWDANQRLMESRADGVMVTRYGYDPLGRRLFKDTDGRRTIFYWDGDALVAEALVVTDTGHAMADSAVHSVAILEQQQQTLQSINASCAPREYVYYPETFEPLGLIEKVNREAHIYLCHNDPNGGVQRLLDRSGSVVWDGQYGAMGDLFGIYIDKVGNKVRLQGQYWDSETSFSYNRNRYLDSAVCEFISIDPLRIVPSSNLYGYAPNTFGWIDPLGLSCQIRTVEHMGIDRKLRVGHSLTEAQAIQAVQGGVDVIVSGGTKRERRRLAKRIAEGAGGGGVMFHRATPSAGYGTLPHYHPVDQAGQKMPAHVFFDSSGRQSPFN